jgi:Calcineurin-like phosphoesterase
MFRFLHSSDLHIGKRFGNLPEDLRGRLREARHSAIGRLAGLARENGANTILLAGDTFDTETPSPAMVRQALAAMSQQTDLRWVLLPGNHDSLLADELWNRARDAQPENVLLATTAEPIALEPGVVVLPAPCTTRRPGRDLTEWMDLAATPDDTMRIGLAHGAIQSFSEEGGAFDIIAPDRVQRAGLDYMALGDWHGQTRVNERTWYSGTPEPDRFKHRVPGQALVVTLTGRGAGAHVASVPSGLFDWRTVDLALLGGDDAAASLRGCLPAAAVRRQTLLRVVATGRVRITARSALTSAFEAAMPDFGYAVLDTGGLSTDCDITDLDLIDQAGALRQAAEALLAESRDDSLAAHTRDVAREALVRLFSYCEAPAQ